MSVNSRFRCSYNGGAAIVSRFRVLNEAVDNVHGSECWFHAEQQF